MVGEVSDVMSAAVVIGAANKAATPRKTQPAAQQKTDDAKQTESTKNAAKLQDSFNNDPAALEKLTKDRQDKEPMDEQSVSLITKELNELMDKINCNLKFQYHKEVDLMSVQMIDKDTEEVLKEFPPEDMIDNMSKAKEWIGAFIDRNA